MFVAFSFGSVIRVEPLIASYASLLMMHSFFIFAQYDDVLYLTDIDDLCALLLFDCRFHVVAYLQQIWWFEVDGVVKFPFPADIYTLSFRLHIGRFSKRLGRRVSNFEHTHGWDIKPVRFELSTSDGQQASYECCLDDPEHDDAYGNHKRGCWVDYKVGEFTVTDADPVTEVKFSMKQIDCTHSKGGLCVDSVFIVPSDLKERKRRGVLK